MNTSITTLVAGMTLCMLMSAFFSATETAFSSMNRIRLKNLAKNGNQRASETLRLAEDFDRLLSTILIGNNIVNITMASLATLLFTRLWGDDALTVSTVVTTALVLLFGEITPKSMAKEMPERTAMAMTPLLRFFAVILRPLNFLFSLWKKGLALVFKTPEEKSVSEEELLTIVAEAEQEGGIDEHESRLIRSAIEFNDLDAVEIMTPRTDMAALPKSASMLDVRNAFAEHGYSRLPIYESNIDQIIGVLHEKDFYEAYTAGATTFDAQVKPIVFTPPSAKISELLRTLQQNKSHLSVVVDEFGASIGLVTVEDILEELVGEIWDEHDEVREDFQMLTPDSYKVLGGCELDDFFDFFQLKGDPEEYEVQTVSGWVVEQMGVIPSVGDHFDFQNLTITVSKVDYGRILEIHVQLELPAEPAAAPSAE